MGIASLHASYALEAGLPKRVIDDHGCCAPNEENQRIGCRSVEEIDVQLRGKYENEEESASRGPNAKIDGEILKMRRMPTDIGADVTDEERAGGARPLQQMSEAACPSPEPAVRAAPVAPGRAASAPNFALDRWRGCGHGANARRR